MGTWGHKVGESDTFADVYDCFFEHYNNGATPKVASRLVRDDLASYFSDYDDMYDSHFALALAQWETQSLEPALLKKVERFVESGAELKLWEGSDPNDVTVRQRSEALQQFLEKLRKPRPSKKRRKKEKFDFKQRVLIDLPAPDGRKRLSIAESYVDGKYINTVATIMWDRGGGSIFHVTQPDLEFSADWLDSQNLEIKIPSSVEDAISYSPTPDQAYFAGDAVALRYRFV